MNYFFYLITFCYCNSCKAIEANPSAELESVLQWIVAFKEKQDESSETTETTTKAASIVCNDCGKVFPSLDSANIHAYKTNHDSFCESTEQLKPLTEEEKKQKQQELMEKLKQLRVKKAAEEAAQEVENEKKRIQYGKQATELVKKNEEIEMKKIAEERAKQRREDKEAKLRVLAQIEADKLERKQRFAQQTATPDTADIANSTDVRACNIQQEIPVALDQSKSNIQVR